MGAPGTTRGPWRVEGPASYTNPNMGLWSVEGYSNVANDCTLKDAHQIAASGALYEALAEAVEWLTAALECEEWTWDGDQREAATVARDNALAALSLARGKQGK